MASDQVLRKKEHLEAGKKKLEEFRRKKAAAKKVASTNQPQTTGGVQNEKRESVSDSVHITDNDGVGTSDAFAQIPTEGFNIPNLVGKESSIKMDGFKDTNDEFVGRNYFNGLSGLVSASSTGNFVSDNQSSNPEGDTSILSIYHGTEGNTSNNTDGILKDISSHMSTEVSSSDDLGRNSFTDLMQNDSVGRRLEDKNLISSPRPEFLHFTSSANHSSSESEPERKFPLFSDVGDKQSRSAIEDNVTANHSSPWISNNGFSHFNTEARSSSNLAFVSPLVDGRPPRPSFLDSFQTSKSESTPISLFGAGKVHDSGSKVPPLDGFGSSFSEMSANSSVSNGDVPGTFNYSTKGEDDIFTRRQTEDFAELEQHIEDLTQEKFSLQRALDASRALADSLASENSTLTESFNQQGSIVNQLKLDTEMLQEEIRAHMEELKALKEAYVNVQMECSAADERAKLLASEVIELEEKALRLRSNELKVERQLENTRAEMSSYRKKVSSLEKDREDLMSTMNALQEEKKLLQTKLRNASSGGKSVGLVKTSISKKDASTSTDYLDSDRSGSENAEHFDSGAHQDEGTSSQEIGMPTLDGLPMDHRRLISNINTLIAEVSLEKDQLMQALATESSRSSTLLELNKELTRKLEVQTQRLELLTSQSLAGDNRQYKQVERYTNENPTYADEGDEVVERVLGWIMKLFPGGPSRRRSL